MYWQGANNRGNSEISYNGTEVTPVPDKSVEAKAGFKYSYGDQLVAFGYYNTQFKNIVFKPTQDTIITFLFQSTGICPPTLFDSRDSIIYVTVKIGNQCWMAENLRYLPSVTEPGIGSNTTQYFYVYDYQGNSVVDAKATANYQNYGVLYNWPAAMDGAGGSNSVPSGVQGVCPIGWHIPSDEEWKILEGEVDSIYGYPDPEWDLSSYRGFDAGGNLKSTDIAFWNQPNIGATNSSGFTALAGGDRNNLGSFGMQGMTANFWTSRESGPDYGYGRRIYNNYPTVYRSSSTYKTSGFSIRCLRD